VVNQSNNTLLKLDPEKQPKMKDALTAVFISSQLFDRITKLITQIIYKAKWTSLIYFLTS